MTTPQYLHTRDWFYDVTLDEGYTTGYGVQRSLAAMAGTNFVFGLNEPGVQHFHRSLADLLAESPFVAMCLHDLHSISPNPLHRAETALSSIHQLLESAFTYW
jgi:hypothetical protein